MVNKCAIKRHKGFFANLETHFLPLLESFVPWTLLHLEKSHSTKVVANFMFFKFDINCIYLLVSGKKIFGKKQKKDQHLTDFSVCRRSHNCTSVKYFS